ncbi:hypothetical protein ACLBWS_05775 [Brucellaceae bacterium D45D]
MMSEKVDEKIYINRLRQLQGRGDTELQHVHADDVLCDLLKQLGYEEIVSEFDKVDKWYA